MSFPLSLYNLASSPNCLMWLLLCLPRHSAEIVKAVYIAHNHHESQCGRSWRSPEHGFSSSTQVTFLPLSCSHKRDLLKVVLQRFCEQTHLTISSKLPSFTLSGMLFTIVKFKIVIVKSAN
ncbi:unnamed protein product [Ixodes persulcatus]